MPGDSVGPDIQRILKQNQRSMVIAVLLRVMAFIAEALGKDKIITKR